MILKERIIKYFIKLKNEKEILNNIKNENDKLLLQKQQMEDILYAFNPEYPNNNTPLELIDFESVVNFKVDDAIIILNTDTEVYTLSIHGDGYLYNFLKTLIPVGKITLIGDEKLIMYEDGKYDFKINLHEYVDVKLLLNSLYKYHDKPQMIKRESKIIQGEPFDYKESAEKSNFFKEFIEELKV